jgi:tRNA pseudouridine13 synthase
MQAQLTADVMPVSSLPFITADLPGIGGEIKAEPAHFVVEEIPLYEPVGEGEHVYVCLTCEGWTTRALQERLVDLFGLREVDVGCAGLKDKHARATQTFSLLLRDVDEATVARRIEEALPVEVVWARRHRNKLRRGHLLGNRFRIVVLDPEAEAMARAGAIAQAVQAHGLPNFYGVQRFGISGENAKRGHEILLGRGPRKRWLRRFLLSAYQAALFNAWLTERMRRGWFERVLTGDIAKKTDTGGLFEVEDAEVEFPRFQRGEITYTGPIYGARMRWASSEPGELERTVLEAAGVTTEMLRQARLDGSRRPARLLLSDLCIEPRPDGLLFTFSLPKGTYATTVLREFMKTEVMALPEEQEG